MKIFGQRLRELRGTLTQAEAASSLGITSSSYAMYEVDRREPNYQTLVRIAEHYGVTTDYLLGLTDCKSPDVDVQAICKKTGLSFEAVEQLQNGFFSGAQAVGLLNELLTMRPFHECITYMQASFDLFDFSGDNSSREFDGNTVTLSGEYASGFFHQSAEKCFSLAFGLMEISRRREGE